MANNIHPTAIIGPDVQLGDDNIIGPFVVIGGRTIIGDRNWIGPSVAIGMPPEVASFEHGAAWDVSPEGEGVRIGSNNVIHEFSTVQSGWAGQTIIGDRCFLMAKSHVGHDCVIDDDVRLAGGSVLGGHVHIWPLANVGMGTVIHQWAKIGPGAMIGMGSAVRRDAPAFGITVGNPARTTGINTVGLQRNGVAEDALEPLTEHLLGRRDIPADVPESLRSLLERWQQENSED